MQIEVNNVTYLYNEKDLNETFALKGVSFNVEKGDFIAIVGKTGSGKSTLIKMLNGLLLPKTGYIKIDDFYITGDKKFKKDLLKDKTKEFKKYNSKISNIRKKVGLVFQFPEYQLFSETILKDVMFGPKNFGFSEEEAKKVAIESLKLVGISEDKYLKSPFEISGGQKRRVAIAGVLSSNPEIIVLDEPTAGLDANGKKEIMNLISKLNEQGKTIIFVTHDMDVVLNYAKKVIVFNDGKIVNETIPSKLFKENDLSIYSLEEPPIYKFARKLISNGFNIDLNKSLNIDILAKEIVEGIKK